jgi:hypothetical protein
MIIIGEGEIKPRKVCPSSPEKNKREESSGENNEQ